MDKTERANLHRRLMKIIGQVQAIDRMNDMDVSADELLTHIHAAKAALHSAGKYIMENELKQRMREGIERGDADAAVDSVESIVKRFANL